MRTLTIDTSLDKMFVTIGNNGQVDLSRTVENTAQRYHSALLIPVIIELLQKKGLTMQDIDAVGVNIGPGSFTGIRASATVARVIGQQLDIPVVGVSSLQIFSLLNDTDKNSICLLDAKKGKAYTGIFSPEGEIIQEPVALEYEQVFENIRNNDFYIIADNVMTEKLKSNEFECINLKDVVFNFGIYLADLTYRHLKTGNEFKWYNLKPLYIQPPPITMPKNISC